MSYQQALEAAGAEIHEFKEFGSYQGDWFALVTYKSEKGWIRGCYGSCSGCDSFEAEFGWDDRGECDQHIYKFDAECKGCQAAKAKYDAKLAEFGRPYLNGLSGSDVLLAELDKQSEWDNESKEAATWIRSL